MQHTTPGAGDPAGPLDGSAGSAGAPSAARPQRGPPRRAGRGSARRGAPARAAAPRAPRAVRARAGAVRPAAPGSGAASGRRTRRGAGRRGRPLRARTARRRGRPAGGRLRLLVAARAALPPGGPGGGPRRRTPPRRRTRRARRGRAHAPPCPLGWTPQARLLGRSAYHVPTPAECGGVPDSYALLETVRRVRAEGGHPAVLLLCVADDPTGTVAPPELVREACEAAVAEGLHIVSDETWRDTLHRPHDTVLVSPGEMCPGDVTVLSDLSGAVAPASWPAAVARFPGRRRVAGAPGPRPRRAHRPRRAAARPTGRGRRPRPRRAGTGDRAGRRRARPARQTGRRRAPRRARRRSTGPAPEAGRHLYADLDPLRERLAERGVTDSIALEEYLSERLGTPVPGGHRFGDEPGALRARLATLPLLGTTPGSARRRRPPTTRCTSRTWPGPSTA